jgi:acetyl esterase
VLFSLDTHDRVMREYAAGAGVVVAGVDYAHSPEARFPVALEQIVGVVRWLRGHAADHAVDPARIAISGDSVGANLAMAAALTLRDAGERDFVRALVLNYGVYDLDFDRPSYLKYGRAGALLTRSEMIGYWDQYLRDRTDRDDPRARLMLADVRGLPASFLGIAEQDPLFDENMAMAQKLRSADVDATAVVYPGTTHSYLEAVSMAEIARDAIREQSEWLRRRLIHD